MTKVMRIVTRLNIGGPAIHTILLSSGLDRKKFRDILVCGSTTPDEGDMSYFAGGRTLEIVSVPEMGREISPGKDFLALVKLCRIMRREKPDIVHTHMAKAGALGRIAAVLTGVPVRIHTFHGHVLDGYFNRFNAGMFLLIERFLALFTDRIVLVSENVRDEIVGKLKVADRRKSVIIPLGFELEKFLDDPSGKRPLRARFMIDDDTVIVGIVGRLVPIKNHRMFLRAAERTIHDNPGVKIKFFVIGDGEMRKGLEDYARQLGIAGDVFFTGWMENTAQIYKDLDIVAMTSLNEGTPVSIIEAMASAKAVVSTSVGGVKDLIKDDENGLLVKTIDADEFAHRLSPLLRDKAKRLKLGLNGRRFVMERYAKARLLKDMENLYDECLKARE